MKNLKKLKNIKVNNPYPYMVLVGFVVAWPANGGLETIGQVLIAWGIIGDIARGLEITKNYKITENHHITAERLEFAPKLNKDTPINVNGKKVK